MTALICNMRIQAFALSPASVRDSMHIDAIVQVPMSIAFDEHLTGRTWLAVCDLLAGRVVPAVLMALRPASLPLHGQLAASVMCFGV